MSINYAWVGLFGFYNNEMLIFTFKKKEFKTGLIFEIDELKVDEL